MQMLYNSDSFVVVRFDVPAQGDAPARGGYEIVDKLARRDIFIEGRVAETFKQGVEALAGQDPDRPDVDAIDGFIETYTRLSQQPLILH